MIDSLFYFLTCLIRDNIRRREKKDDKDKRLYRYKRTKDRERERERNGERESSNRDRLPLSLYIWAIYHCGASYSKLFFAFSMSLPPSIGLILLMMLCLYAYVCTTGNLVRK